MKRTALRRGKPLARGAGLARGEPMARGKRLRQVNPERRKKAHAQNYGAPHPETGLDRGDAVRAMGCAVSSKLATDHDWTHTAAEFLRGCSEKIDAAHTIARGMGGAKGDRFVLVPLCRRHHGEAGEARTSQRAKFQRVYRIDLDALAATIADDLTASGYP